METPEQPQIYLITPSEFDPDVFLPLLDEVMQAYPVACVRLDLASQDEAALTRAADALRELCHARDVAVVIRDHVVLAERLGLDGVHLSDAARSVRDARKALGPDAIVGSYCADSRHDGLSAGEAGADYISFGPIGASPLGDGTSAELDLFHWWSEVIEVPVVAEGSISADDMARLAPVADFIALGHEIWSRPDPKAALGALIDAMG